jgi:hypothetical protein
LRGIGLEIREVEIRGRDARGLYRMESGKKKEARRKRI